MAWGRTLFWLLVSIGITIGVNAVFWLVLRQPFFLGFLFLPFLFGLGRWWDRQRAERRERPDLGPGSALRTCPRCGFRSVDPEARYCPRDGSPLV